MEGKGEKGFSCILHILKREQMKIQDDKIGERDSDKQPQIHTDRKSKPIFGANL